ncbi:MAG: general stress protein [Bacillota bacterium]
MEAQTLIGVFNSRSQAERAVTELQKRGLTGEEISVVSREDRLHSDRDRGGQDLSEGAYTGGVLGGLAGLLAGAGALAIPGIGPVIAAGPIAGAITGAVGGGIAGSLIDLGIPEERGRYYEDRVKQGDILAVVKSSPDKVNDAANVFRRNGAQDVETR